MTCSKCKAVDAKFYEYKNSRSSYCIDCTKKLNTEFYQKNKDKIKQKIRDKYKKNQIYFRLRDAKWRNNNPEVKMASRFRYKARKLGAVGHFTAEEWIALCDKYNNVCVCCKEVKKLTPDHIKPLSKGGSNFISNIQPLCLSCNTRKKDKEIYYV